MNFKILIQGVLQEFDFRLEQPAWLTDKNNKVIKSHDYFICLNPFNFIQSLGNMYLTDCSRSDFKINSTLYWPRSSCLKPPRSQALMNVFETLCESGTFLEALLPILISPVWNIFYCFFLFMKFDDILTYSMKIYSIFLKSFPPTEDYMKEVISWCGSVGMLTKIRDQNFYYYKYHFNGYTDDKEKSSSRNQRQNVETRKKMKVFKNFESFFENTYGSNTDISDKLSMVTMPCIGLSPFTQYYLNITALNSHQMPVCLIEKNLTLNRFKWNFVYVVHG